MQKSQRKTNLELDADEQALMEAFEAGHMNKSSPSKASLEIQLCGGGNDHQQVLA
jgi:hypothetical protein